MRRFCRNRLHRHHRWLVFPIYICKDCRECHFCDYVAGSAGNLRRHVERHFRRLRRDWRYAVIYGTVGYPAFANNKRVLGFTEPAGICKCMKLFGCCLTRLPVLKGGSTSLPSRTKRGFT